VFNTDEF
jgi:WD repeat-containing protein 45